jgi:alanyl-tRNA synthetase
VGIIKILSVTRLRGGVRVEYVAGRRAYDFLDAVQRQNHQISNLLSVKPLQTAPAVQRLLQQREALSAKTAGLEREHFNALAEQLRGAGNVIRFEEELTGDGVRRLADAVKDTCGGVAAVFSGSDGAGYQYALARQTGSVRELCRALNAALDGRGGGRDENFQQGSLRAPRAEIEAFLHDTFLNGKERP